MDLEHLTKHQIVLLTLLVSFVTSIATGIVTVSLMDQAPQSVTRTINQIVERTVETVVPQSQGAATAVVTEKTVIVKDDDLAAQSIAAVQRAIVRLVAKDGDMLLARGVIVGEGGVVLTDRGALVASGSSAFEAILPGGERVAATLGEAEATSTGPLATLELAVGTTTSFGVAPLADLSKVRLGQSVIRIGGTGADTVGTGVIASLLGAHPSLIEASVSSATPGSVLITLFGEVLGIVTTDALAQSPYVYTIPSAASPANP